MTKMQTLRIALLIADTPLPEIVAKYGDYNILYTNLLKRALIQEGLEQQVQLDITAFDVVKTMAYPEQPETFDALLISGSAATAADDLPWITRLVEFTRELPSIAPNSRLVGICFGHQIIARAFGGQLERNSLGWEFGWSAIDLNEAGQAFFNTDKAQVRLQQVHKDHVAALPPQFELLGTTSISSSQIMWKPHQIFSVQAHPEFSTTLVKDLLEIRHQRGIIDNATAERGLSKVGLEDDGDWIGGKILKFMLHKL
ncbi:class I glutamine amidotransferase-like protein [Syncephalis fuscata]|nr:class I glutamine amidotransferase-like protein [Syncephalis fuscata]